MLKCGITLDGIKSLVVLYTANFSSWSSRRSGLYNLTIKSLSAIYQNQDENLTIYFEFNNMMKKGIYNNYFKTDIF